LIEFWAVYLAGMGPR